MKTTQLALLSAILAAQIGTVMATTNSSQPTPPALNINFPGLSISSNQFLAVNLAIATATTSSSTSTTSATTCYVDVNVNGVAVNSSAISVTSQTPVFYIAATGPTATTPAAQPEFFQVNVVADSTVSSNNCAGLIATLAVHNTTSHDLQLLVNPVPPAPPAQGAQPPAPPAPPTQSTTSITSKSQATVKH